MKAMILAAGYGRRLAPLTDTTPKPLLYVHNQSLIERNINSLLNIECSGDRLIFSEIVINVSYLGSQIVDHVRAAFPNEKITFSKEKAPLGTGGAILNALSFFEDQPFLLMNSDIVHKINLADLRKNVPAAHLVGVPNPDHNPNGDFSIKKDRVLVKSDSNNLTWSGISIINPIIFKQSTFENAHFNIWDTVLVKLIERGQVTGEESTALWIDVGTQERLSLANQMLKEENEHHE